MDMYISVKGKALINFTQTSISPDSTRELFFIRDTKGSVWHPMKTLD
jgi:hypothetical protein